MANKQYIPDSRGADTFPIFAQEAFSIEHPKFFLVTFERTH